MCRTISCPLFQECCILCTWLCCEFCCCGIAAPCVAGTMTARMNQQNSSDINFCCIRGAWFFPVSLLLSECDIVCLFWIIQQALFLGRSSQNLFFKGTTKFSTYKSVQSYKTQSLIFSVPCADKQIEAASTSSPNCTTSLSGVLLGFGERDRDWCSKPHCYCLLTRIDCDSISLSHTQAGSGISMSVTAVSSLGRSVDSCPLFWIWTRKPARQKVAKVSWHLLVAEVKWQWIYCREPGVRGLDFHQTMPR